MLAGGEGVGVLGMGGGKDRWGTRNHERTGFYILLLMCLSVTWGKDSLLNVGSNTNFISWKLRCTIFCKLPYVRRHARTHAYTRVFDCLFLSCDWGVGSIEAVYSGLSLT